MTETNIFYETGDIQFSTCQTIVVPVNCEGTMDEGIASIFRRRYPYMFERYKWICEQGLLAPGKLWIYNSPSKRKILIFPVLQHGEERYRYMELGLAKFLATIPLAYKQSSLSAHPHYRKQYSPQRFPAPLRPSKEQY